MFTTFPPVQQVAVCRALAVTSSNKKSLKRLSLCKSLSKWKEASVKSHAFCKICHMGLNVSQRERRHEPA